MTKLTYRRTSRFIADDFWLALIHIKKKECQVGATALLTSPKQLARRLEQYIDRGVELSSLLIS